MRLYQIDAFTDHAFGGNPAAVCLPDDLTVPGTLPDDAWMQAFAAEMNLSETAFVARRDDGDLALRWFTPGAEVDLCGHATLATAHALWQAGDAPTDGVLRFHTRSGVLTCRHTDVGIEMDFPVRLATPISTPAALADALGAVPAFVGRDDEDLLVVLDAAAAVRGLRPNMERLAELQTRGVIVTAASDVPDADFVSRFFAPRVGIPEDPVTGSAHCCLAPYWGSRMGRDVLVGYQASPRGGHVRVRLQSDRVILTGQAVMVFEGRVAPAAR